MGIDPADDHEDGRAEQGDRGRLEAERLVTQESETSDEPPDDPNPLVNKDRSAMVASWSPRRPPRAALMDLEVASPASRR